MRSRILVLVAALAALAAPPARAASDPPRVELRTARAHPMKYWLARPLGLKPGERPAVLVVIPDARREFEAVARRFAGAQDSLGTKFVVVVPIVLGSGGAAQRVAQVFPYDAAMWARADKDGPCAFDDAGLVAVLADVRAEFHALGSPFLTGLEAAGHVIFAQAFLHPERWRAVVVVAPNYQGRCLEDGAFSKDPSRQRLPIVVLHGERDALWGSSPLPQQVNRAANEARAHGFAALTMHGVPGEEHDYMPRLVLTSIRDSYLR